MKDSPIRHNLLFQKARSNKEMCMEMNGKCAIDPFKGPFMILSHKFPGIYDKNSLQRSAKCSELAVDSR